jgi:hypothetical protein
MNDSTLNLLPATLGTTVEALPEWFGEEKFFRFHADGAWWVTNGHVAYRTIAEERGVELLAADAETLVASWLAEEGASATPRFPYALGGAPDDMSDIYVDIGASVYAFAYVVLTEHLFPACTWIATGHKKVARVMLGYTVVAFVMPTIHTPRAL